MTSVADNPEQVATLRIELLDTDPLIWRQVEVPVSITLKVLHDTVQAAMGWFDQHLWEFRLGEQRYGLAIPGDDDWGGSPPLRADKVRLAEVLKPGKTVLDYTYDFGDSWEHRLIFTDVRPGKAGEAYPRYVAGQQAAPPEDCGGLPGFYEALEALANPKHPDHAEVADWLGFYSPEIEDLVLRIAVDRIARRRRPGAGRAKRSKA